MKSGGGSVIGGGGSDAVELVFQGLGTSQALCICTRSSLQVPLTHPRPKIYNVWRDEPPPLGDPGQLNVSRDVVPSLRDETDVTGGRPGAAAPNDKGPGSLRALHLLLLTSTFYLGLAAPTPRLPLGSLRSLGVARGKRDRVIVQWQKQRTPLRGVFDSEVQTPTYCVGVLKTTNNLASPWRAR